MSEGMKIVLTAVVGAVLGIISFVFGQVIQRMFIEPIQAQRLIIGRIAHALTYWSNIWQQRDLPPEQRAEHEDDLKRASEAIRQLASDLRASIRPIPLYGFMESLNFVVSRKDIGFVSYLLMQWQLRMKSEWIALVDKIIQNRLKITFGNEAAAEDIQKFVNENAFMTRRS